MTWIAVAVGAYLLGAVTIILDKFLLSSGRVGSPIVYSFYIALLGLGSLLFFPFTASYHAGHLIIPSSRIVLLSFFSGGAYMAGIAALYGAIKKSEAGRVTPVVGAVVPLVSFLLMFTIGQEGIKWLQIMGVVLLIIGGLLISFDLPLHINRRKFFAGLPLSFAAGILLAIAYMLFKFVYSDLSFLDGFIWTRIGALLLAIVFLLVPAWRKDIIKSFHEAKKPKKHAGTAGLFIGNKILGGTSSILLNYAIALGSVTLVNAMVSVQYVFLLVFIWFLSKKYHAIFAEKLLFWDWVQKIIAIIIIGLGIVFVTVP